MKKLSESQRDDSCRALYEEGAALLAELEEGRLDARLLLEHFCGIDINRLLSHPESPVEPGDRDAFLEGIRRRAAREPLAYIIGEQSFMGLPFAVSEQVLIPEQDTENLVEEALRLIDDGSRILDLCTGSGCILLSLLRYSNGCVGVGTDISAGALEIAGRNARALGLEDRAEWAQGDLFSALDTLGAGDVPSSGGIVGKGSPFFNDRPALSRLLSGSREFDLIISNPPYISSAVIETLAPEVRCAEPRLALDGGEDGLDFYRRIIREAPGYLVIGGRLMLEIGYDQAEAVSALLEEAGYYQIETFKDYGGRDRVVTAVCSMRQKTNLVGGG